MRITQNCALCGGEVVVEVPVSAGLAFLTGTSAAEAFEGLGIPEETIRLFDTATHDECPQEGKVA